ncbi:helix-turn-helix domain-containing protein [Actinoallomurus rhizosphaericola]|uniref:helix-turn-helix domain-containing protein n=1 Tax=Actinoallomurus rhizosphaericola TaxID=2952536 RepID=UPI0020920515|nr:helix-turn-helix transcriptional regulator [Actinoallomurus rhizosphaericola]MCO5999666.1 helix-turn-helix transcriptional regulator [Actinoallomurus rhizosphaericola]
MTSKTSGKPATATVSGLTALAYWGDELRFHREQAGLTQEGLGRAIHMSPSMIAMVETGRRAPRIEFIKSCDQVLGTNGALARLWKRIIKHSYLEWFRPFVDVESEATGILEYEPQAVPGLLQTEDYARAQLKTGHIRKSDEEIEKHVAARMSRQEILTRSDPPFVWVILDEAVLRRPVGGVEVMRDQLARLVRASQSPHIVLQVLPFAAGAHGGMSGPMVLFTLPDETKLVYAEAFGGGQIIGLPEEVAKCHVILDLLRACALPPDDSARLIADLIGE